MGKPARSPRKDELNRQDVSVVLRVQLNPGLSGPRQAFLREPSGYDELACSAAQPWVASDLLARVLVEGPGSALVPGDGADMSLADRDRLIAELHRYCYGDELSSRAGCAACGKSFELGFSLGRMLSEVVAGVEKVQREHVSSQEADVYTLTSGIKLRLPAVTDEQAVQALPPERAMALLRERCILGTANEASVDPARPGAEPARSPEELLDALAPVLSFALPVTCAECGAAQAVEFDMVRFFLTAMSRERALLAREVHLLARAYHWSHHEILSLPRSQRRAYVRIVIGEADAEGLVA